MRISRTKIINKLISENAEYNDNFKGKYAYINGINHAFDEITFYIDKLNSDNKRLRQKIKQSKTKTTNHYGK